MISPSCGRVPRVYTFASDTIKSLQLHQPVPCHRTTTTKDVARLLANGSLFWLQAGEFHHKKRRTALSIFAKPSTPGKTTIARPRLAKKRISMYVAVRTHTKVSNIAPVGIYKALRSRKKHRNHYVKRTEVRLMIYCRCKLNGLKMPKGPPTCSTKTNRTPHA